LLGVIPNPNNLELPLLKLRGQCPINVGIEVNLLLFEFDCTIVAWKLMTPKEIFPSPGLDYKTISHFVKCQASNDEKNLVIVWPQTESIGKVTAMVIACIERKSEQLCVGEEL
jgi:hypothetical protein